MLKKEERNILLCTILYLLIFIISKLILNLFNLEYLEGVYKVTILIGILGILVGLIQIIVKSKSKVLKVFLILTIIAIIIFCIIASQILLLFYTFTFVPQHIVEKDGQKMVGYVYGFLDTRVEYYPYVNLFLRKKTIQICEDYGKGCFNPIRNEYGYNYEVEKTTYYDEQGNVISEKVDT